MKKTKADGSRASRIRAKLRRAEEVTPDESAFLADYDATRGKKGRKPAPIPSREVPRPETPIVSVPPIASFTPPPPPAPEPRRAEPTMVPIAFDAPPSSAPQSFAPLASACTIPNCPCKSGGAGGQFCPTLQKNIYPPMDEDAARGFAATIMNVIAFIGRFTREDKRYIRPTEAEIAKFGRAIRLVQMRRANWAGAWDDLMAFGWAIGAYGMRVINEPSERKKLPASTMGVPDPKKMEEPARAPEGMSV